MVSVGADESKRVSRRAYEIKTKTKVVLEGKYLVP